MRFFIFFLFALIGAAAFAAASSTAYLDRNDQISQFNRRRLNSRQRSAGNNKIMLSFIPSIGVALHKVG
jgi:hypothetical protein